MSGRRLASYSSFIELFFFCNGYIHVFSTMWTTVIIIQMEPSITIATSMDSVFWTLGDWSTQLRYSRIYLYCKSVDLSNEGLVVKCVSVP